MAREGLTVDAAPTALTLRTTLALGFVTLWSGATMVLEPAFDPGRALHLIQSERITVFMAVPTLFQVMAQHPQAKVFRDSLAIAGVSGTLRHRFHQGPLTGHLQGKSGALTGNVALAGYLQPPHYPPLVVTVLINHAQEPAAQLRRRLDEILEWVAQLSQGC